MTTYRCYTDNNYWYLNTSWRNTYNTTQWGIGFKVVHSSQGTRQKTVRPSWAKVFHNWYKATDIAQEYTQFAYDIWWIELFITVQCEQHREPAVCNWKWDCWFCQIHASSHPEIISDPRRWVDRKREMQQCKRLLDEWTAFYGKDRINKKTWLPCYVEAQKYLEIIDTKW